MNSGSLMKTAKDLRENVRTSVETSRETAGEVLETTGRQIKRRSRKAGHFIEGSGNRIGRNLETGAKKMRGGRRFSPFRHLRKHPIQALMLAGVGFAIVGAFVLPAFLRNREEETSDYFAVP
jgi:hypothetical protein